VFNSGKVVEYWWPDPAHISDSDLVLKTSDVSAKADTAYVDIQDTATLNTSKAYIDSLTQQATEAIRGTAKIATTATAITGTNDTDYLTALKAVALYQDQHKSFKRSVSVSRGTAYLNEILFYMDNATSVTGIATTSINNVMVKTNLTDTYAAPSYPIAIPSASVLYIQFDYININYLNGSITITGREN